jgi:coenzyme F420-reducing hydrogenase gamma subunit
MVAHGTACLGPITQAGCGALCPSFHRGCYGCFGPMEQPNVEALHRQLLHLGVEPDAIDRLMRTFDVEAFARVAPEGARP